MVDRNNNYPSEHEEEDQYDFTSATTVTEDIKGDHRISYVAEPTCALFHADNQSLVRGIMGCFGSGKSSACVWELFCRAREGRVWKGVRRTKWAIIRNTYSELALTTLETFRHWIPEQTVPGYSMHVVRTHPMRAELRMDLDDGTKVEADFIFIALDKEADVGKLKSMEFTGVWINEAVEVPYSVFITALTRARRFPDKEDGGYNWAGLIMDTNPCDVKHWWYILAEQKCPDIFAFWKQPPAILPLPRENKDDPLMWVPNKGQPVIDSDGQVIQYAPAENVTHQNAGFNYWLDLAKGQEEAWCRVYLMGQYGLSRAGKPVYPKYVDDIHCSKEPLEVWRGLPLYLGFDYGRTPCVVFAQQIPSGALWVLEEITSEDMGIREFAKVVKAHLNNKYSGMKIVSIGDPQGQHKSEISDELSCLKELAAAGIPTKPALTQNFTARTEAVNGFLNRMANGKPAFQLDPKCEILREGFQREYRYGERKTSAGRIYTDEPLKLHPHSDVQDALQYIAMELDGRAGQRGVEGGSGRPRRRNLKHGNWNGSV